MIEIVESFPLNTVQDFGRFGQTALGINRSGAMDRLALRLGNIMLGNDENLAGCEFQMFPVTLRFAQATRIALTGSVHAELDGRRLPGWWVFDVAPGQVLVLQYPATGARTYLTARGGIDVPPVLGSRSTSLKIGIGGHEGRSLQGGDILRAGKDFHGKTAEFGILSPAAALNGSRDPRRREIRFIRAAEYGEFAAHSVKAFEEDGWTVTPNSNRQGLTLRGPALERAPREMRSHGIMPGVIQVPPSGQPVIQLSDANCAGGYPKIGCVIEADLWRLGQAAPGTVLNFREVGHEEGIGAADEIEAYIARVRRGLSYLAEVWS